MNGCFLDTSTFSYFDSKIFEALPIKWSFYKNTEISRLEERIINQDIIITNKVPIHLSKDHPCKLICVTATGINNISEETKKNREVRNVENYCTQSVSQYVFTIILNHFFNLNKSTSFDWRTSKNFCYHSNDLFELSSLRFGLIGHGSIGKNVKNIALSFNMEVLLGDSRKSDKLNLNELFSQCNVVSLHLPLTEHTKEFIKGDHLKLMPKNSILINSARGPLLDEDSIYHALKERPDLTLYLDVLKEEPPVKSLFLDHPQIKITPHIAWSAVEAQKRLLQKTVDNIKNYFSF